MYQADGPTTLQIPRITPQPPRRPSCTAVALAMAALLVAGAFGLLVVANRDDTVGTGPRTGFTTPTTPAAPTSPATPETAGTTPTTAATTATTAPTTATTAPAPRREVLTADSRVSLDGMGPVDIGMTYEEAAAAAGIPLTLKPAEAGSTCTYAWPQGGPSDEVAFMVVDGRIVRVDVGIMGPDRVKTVSGIGKGSTEADVLRTYPGRVTVRSHPYIEPGKYLVYTPADPSYSHLSMIFETVNGEVRTYRAGLKEQVSWVEGCG